MYIPIGVSVRGEGMCVVREGGGEGVRGEREVVRV